MRTSDDIRDIFRKVISEGDANAIIELFKNNPKQQESWDFKMFFKASCLGALMKTATAEEYEKLLSLLPAGEQYAECALQPNWLLSMNQDGKAASIAVSGTLVLLAAALGRAEILKLLLKRGCDVNCASFSAVSAVVRDRLLLVEEKTGFPKFRERRPASVVSSRDIFRKGILEENETVTPLAAAVLMGHADCVRILLQHGAWMESDPGVSWAMHLACREEDGDYRAARELVLNWGDQKEHRPVLSALTDCSLRQLRNVLHKYSYSREECAAFLENALMSEEPAGWEGSEICGKVMEIVRISPESLLNARVMSVLSWYWELDDFSFASFWPEIKGRRADITSICWNCLPDQRLEEVLGELSQYCELTVNYWNTYGLSTDVYLKERYLPLIRRCATVCYDNRTKQVGSLAETILATGDETLIRSTLEEGVIRETEKDLLALVKGRRDEEMLSQLILTTERDKSLLYADWEEPEETGLDSYWNEVRFGDESFSCPELYAACAYGKIEFVRAELYRMKWMEECGISFDNEYVPKPDVVVCTLLGAAAIGGQNEILRMLVEEFSFPVDEWKYGYYTVWNEYFDRTLLDLPLAAAINDHWETVKLLLEKGATPHWDDPQIREFWQKLRGTDLAEEVRTHLGDEPLESEE